MGVNKRIAIDLVPIRVGEGGTGSGIWTYARELVHHMDQQDFQGLEIVCLVNEGQVPYLAGLKQIQLIKFPEVGKNILFRLLWVHIFLPLICLFRWVDVLHKVATEGPWLCPAKRVTTVHDFYYEFLLEQHPPENIRLYERLENFYFSFVTKMCFRKSRSIIAVSEATKQEAIQRYPSAADRIHVIHHGAPLLGLGVLGCGSLRGTVATHEPISAPPHASTPIPWNDTFRVLCVAKFMEHKGQHLLIEAFESLLTEHPSLVGNVQLDLRGFHNDEDYFAGIQQQISLSHFSDYINILPFNPDEGLDEIYRDTDLVVLLSSYEGFGLPVLEAQGMGIPVLCSDLPVLQEVGGDGAVYVGRDKMNEIAAALYQFIHDPTYHERMTELAQRNITRFSWCEAAKSTIRVYQDC